MLVKAVCLTSAFLAVHSNIIKRITKISRIMKYENYTLIIMYCYSPICYNNEIITHSWLIPDELASCMVPGF